MSINLSLSELIYTSLFIGITATLIMDIWAWLLKVLLKTPSLNYAVVGRWLATLPCGRFYQPNIQRQNPIDYEGLLGWSAHYLTGIVFAGVYILLIGRHGLQAPSIVPALTTGIVTVLFPFFILQPALGLGIAAAKTPFPFMACLKSLMMHSVFGLGLYLSTRIHSVFFSNALL